MGNIREERKRMRIKKIRSYIAAAKEKGNKIDRDAAIAWLIVEFAVSRRTAIEEIEAVMKYDE